MSDRPTSAYRGVREAALVLADGSTFEGEWFGADPANGSHAAGEVVFNTALTGYQEIITDPSYAGQVITFTYPHIGNYGTAPADDESRSAFCRGVIVRDLARRRSNWRSEEDLDAFLLFHGVPGIGGIDTRRLTRIIRDTGAIPGAFGPLDLVDEATLKQAAAAEPGTAGVDLVSEVTTEHPYVVKSAGTERGLVVAAYDFGIKQSILEQLGEFATVHVFPASATAEALLEVEPDGIFLSNGPGDPEMVGPAVDEIRRLLGESVPMFGICLGHQVLGLAAGARTVKLPFGHHGGNHPVRDVHSGRIDITSQNHNFAVDADSLGGIAELTHVNLNDGVCEGMRLVDANAWSVQHHPEAGPGPHDARHLFDDFKTRMEK
ncbi:MAG TPA: glutamine-hydrolyzing carbamoyl-phosphate synthase small subunit [Acidimicrobiales bacterium]|nr:glutamine-hydrolyzing carbamoyl-phosphate synthase small subunit [Acidimicrobiales bacterium]